MSTKENHLKEKFRIALNSTAKVISDDFDLNKKNLEDKKTKDIISLEIDNLTNPGDFIRLRAETDSSALKKKFSSELIYKKNLPSNTSTRSLYNIAEKIRYEALGGQMLKGIEKNFHENYSQIINRKRKDQLKTKEDEIAKLEEQLKNKKAEADDISSRVIPELLAEQGLSEIKLADGSKVSVKKEYRCTLPKDESKRAQCYDWLRDQNLGDIIKNNVFVTFGKGEDNKAKQLLDLAQANGFEPQQKSDVAWMTLTALFRERIESGLDMPSDIFSTWIKDKTKITRK